MSLRNKIFSLMVFTAVAFSAQQPIAWKGFLDKKYEDIKLWKSAITLLQEKQMPITAFLMTVKMNQFFQEPEAKEFIFKTQIDFVNSGFPFPIFDYFNFANIEPSLELSWSPQFYLYKGLFFSGKKNEYWSKYYFNKIKETKNPTLSFYEVIELYKNGNLKEAKKKLEAWLKEYSKEGDEVLTKKVIRTLARIEFEQENYAKSFQLYDDFLLKTKIIDPQDYLEAAWSAFYLKKYERALGFLHNLDSENNKNRVGLERYLLKGMIFKNLCDAASLGQVIQDYEQKYVDVLSGIRKGLPLKNIAPLQLALFQDDAGLKRTQYFLSELKKENNFISRLPSSTRNFSKEFVVNEFLELQKEFTFYEDETLKKAAEQFIFLSEKLKFLDTEISRQLIEAKISAKPSSQQKEIKKEQVVWKQEKVFYS
jgi:hypothetical protein